MKIVININKVLLPDQSLWGHLLKNDKIIIWVYDSIDWVEYMIIFLIGK